MTEKALKWAHILLVAGNQQDLAKKLRDDAEEKRNITLEELSSEQAQAKLVARELPTEETPPRYWQSFYGKNLKFSGRKDILEDLKSGLETEGIVALHGLGGMGKTQIAVEYIQGNQNSYQAIWWIRGENQTTLEIDYVELGIKLGEINLTDKREDQIKKVRSWLNTNKNWLLIFDNAESQQALHNYIPDRSGMGHIIITSRNFNWEERAKTIKVNKWTSEESLEYVRKWRNLPSEKSNWICKSTSRRTRSSSSCSSASSCLHPHKQSRL